MGFFGSPKLKEPHPVHPDDQDLISQSDIKWYVNLTQKSAAGLCNEDQLFQMAAFQKYTDQGMTEQQAARECWRAFPYYYINPSERGKNPLGLDGENAELPFMIKDKVNRLARKLSREFVFGHQTMNAAIRAYLRSQI